MFDIIYAGKNIIVIVDYRIDFIKTYNMDDLNNKKQPIRA